MEKERFSLLLLEPGELYFEDFSCTLIDPNNSNEQTGRVKMCSKSLIFDPKNIKSPIIKIPLRDVKEILTEKNIDQKFTNKHENLLEIKSDLYIEILAGNELLPYIFKTSGDFLFSLNYANIPFCFGHISQLHRAATLPVVEQNSMIATIAHSRYSRFKFDLLWMSDINEKILIDKYVEKINPLVNNPGRVVISNERFYFQPINNAENYPVLKINLIDIKRLIPRRFLLRHIGLEIFYTSSRNKYTEHIYLSFQTNSDREELLDILKIQPLLKLDKLEQDVMTLQWQNGVISNYDYLLYLNSLGDRTFNDLTQYPIFPWILTDYKSEKIDLNDKNIYRDLKKPIGMLNPDRFEKLKERYDEMSEPKFLYGSHYSAPGLVLFYLVRKFPQYMLCLHNGRFDHPDRMFNCISDVFQNCLLNMADFKELVPEFYDVDAAGDFLINLKGINFGFRSDGSKVNDVKLPPWCKDADNFVRILRDALESDWVSTNLNHWIDLIFGYRQRGKEAENANNVFYHLCYEGNVNLESIKELNERHAIEVQIMEFGQIPKQIFTVPHPKKYLNIPKSISTNQKLEIVNNSISNDANNNDIELKLVSKFQSHKSTISQVIACGDFVMTVGHDSMLKMFSLNENRQLRSVSFGNTVLSSCVYLSEVNVLIISCWDDNLIFYDIECSRTICSFRGHQDAVSIIAWADKLNLLASGSWDGSLHVWKDFSEVNKKLPKITQNLFKKIELDAKITYLKFNKSNSMLVSSTDTGELYFFETDSFNIIRQIMTHSSKITCFCFNTNEDRTNTNDESLDKTTEYFKIEDKLVSCCEDGNLQILDVNTGLNLFERKLNYQLYSIAWNRSILYIGTNIGLILLWNMINIRPVKEIRIHSGIISCIVADGDIVLTVGEDKILNVWNSNFLQIDKMK